MHRCEHTHKQKSTSQQCSVYCWLYNLITLSPSSPGGPGGPAVPGSPTGPISPSFPAGPTGPFSPWRTDWKTMHIKQMWQRVLSSCSSMAHWLMYHSRKETHAQEISLITFIFSCSLTLTTPLTPSPDSCLIMTHSTVRARVLYYPL